MDIKLLEEKESEQQKQKTSGLLQTGRQRPCNDSLHSENEQPNQKHSRGNAPRGLHNQRNKRSGKPRNTKPNRTREKTNNAKTPTARKKKITTQNNKIKTRAGTTRKNRKH